MAEFAIRRREYTYSPASRAANETPTVIALKKGDRVFFGSIVQKAISSTANTIAIRVNSAGGGNANGILSAYDTSTGSNGTLVNCNGSDLINSMGFLLTADGGIEFDYVAVGGGGTVTPVVRFTLGYIPHEATS